MELTSNVLKTVLIVVITVRGSLEIVGFYLHSHARSERPFAVRTDDVRSQGRKQKWVQEAWKQTVTLKELLDRRCD